MWRTAICAEEFAATPQERRRLKWNKSWANGQPSFYSSEQVRTAPDDLSNTILKMAKKRAQIDMTLTALGVSDLFTQDIEDLPAELQPTETEAPRRAAAVQAANSANSAGTASMTEHAGMKAAGTRQEVMKIMQSLQQAEKKQFAAYFNVRIAEFKGA
jgi:hypothetical protein